VKRFETEFVCDAVGGFDALERQFVEKHPEEFTLF
jgi:hypothetical protein